MHIDLTGKNALITGGTRGIGRAISKTLASSGARVGAIYRSDATTALKTLAELNGKDVETTLKTLEGRNISFGTDSHFALQADISDEAQATKAVAEAAERFGGAVDIVVLDAASVGAGGPMIGLKTEDWKRNFEVNVHGAFYIVRAVAPHLRKGASVIFISSGAGHDPMEGLSGYGTSKAAANHLATVLAQELGPQGVRVNTVSPGHTNKDETDPNANPDAYTDWQKQIVATTALRRICTAQDVANVVLFFASDLSGFVTGQWVRVNGGRL